MRLGNRETIVVFKITKDKMKAITSGSESIKVYDHSSRNSYVVKHVPTNFNLAFTFFRLQGSVLCGINRVPDPKVLHKGDLLNFKLKTDNDVYVTLNFTPENENKILCDLSWGYNQDGEYKIKGLSDLFFDLKEEL